MKCYPCAAKPFVLRATDRVSLQPLRASLCRHPGRDLSSSQAAVITARKQVLPEKSTSASIAEGAVPEVKGQRSSTPQMTKAGQGHGLKSERPESDTLDNLD